MDAFHAYVAFNEALLTALGMTHEMAHLHAGLAIYVLVQLVLRTRRASTIALQAVFGCEIINEIIERAVYGSWRWHNALSDIALTLFWPTLLYAMGKWRRARWARRESVQVQRAQNKALRRWRTTVLRPAEVELSALRRADANQD